MPEEFSDLQILLRLKRHETPPPGYLEDFLGEFHRRQRAELLRRPLWRIALDRASNLLPAFPALPVPSLAYAGVSAVALVAAAGLLTRHNSGAPGATATAMLSSPAVAGQTAGPVRAVPNFVSVAPLAAVRIAPDLDDNLFGANNVTTPSFVAPPGRSVTVSSDRPRYLLDTRPVRYEARSTSF